jgi:polyphosphate kinase
VVRQEADHIRRYVHIGTGNYNPKTARIYEDFGLLTADPELGADVSDLFNHLTGYSRQPSYRSIIVAPNGMREGVMALIDREMQRTEEGAAGRIVMKLNSLVDEAVIDALYRASQSGVEIDLIVRGICALRPGVPGLSETIRVRSILGRFLEHSRILAFGHAAGSDVYIGSADMMHRNLDRRVEVLVRVTSEAAKSRLFSLLELALADNRSAWHLGPDGKWTRPEPDDSHAVDLQKELMRVAVGRDA